MKKKIIAFVAVFAMSLCGFALAACTDNTGKCAVTFNANGGYFADSGTATHYETVDNGGYAIGEKIPTHTDSTLTFDGWGTSSDSKTVIKLNTYKITSDIEFFAVWSKEDRPTPQHTVTFYNNYTGASTSVFTTKAVDDGTAVEAPSPAPSRSDATFDGWFTQAEGGSLYNFATKVTANLSLYAHWTEGHEEANLTGIQITQNPTKTKYIAGDALDLTGLKVTASYSDGSSKEITGYTTTPAAGAKLTTANTSVTVSYSGKTASFNITVEARKVTKLEIGGELQNKTQKVGALLDVTGLTFKAIYNDGTDEDVDPSDITFTSDGYLTDGRFTAPGETVEVKANYGGRAPTFTLKVEEPTTPQHDVIFDGNKPAVSGNIEKMPNTKTVEEGESFSKPATDPTLLGFTFGGWYKDAACLNAWKFSGENADVMGTEDVTLYAKWTAKTYTIDYKLGGDTTDPVTNGNPETYTAGDSAITLVAPAREHYDFDGWYIIKTGDEEDVKVTKIDYSSITATGISVTAKWTPKTYDLTFELEYEDESTAPYTVEWKKTKPTSYTYGTAKDLPDSSYIEVTTKDGESAPYEFLGWYVKGDDTKTIVSTITKGSSGEKEYVAKIEIATTYSFTYNCGYDHHGDGSTTSTVKIVEGEKAENRDLSELNRKGYEFGGWYNTADCTDGDEYDFDTAVTEAKTVYAKWTPIAYTVVYEGDGFDAIEFLTTYHITDDVIDLTDNEKFTLKEGYYLDGWYYLDKTDKKVTVTAVGAALIDFADSENTITLYAKSSNKYTVKYNANTPEGATGTVDNMPDDDEVAYGATIVEQTDAEGNKIVPDMTDYGFIGWYTDATCTTAWKFDTDVVNSSVGISAENRTFTLYAKWYTKPTNGKYILGSFSGYETWSDVLLGADASSYKATVIRYATEGGKQVAKEWRVSGLTLEVGTEFRFVDYTKSTGIAGLVWNEPYQNAIYYARPDIDPAIITIGTTVADHPNYVVETYAGSATDKWTIEFGTNAKGEAFITLTQEGYIGWRDPKNAGNKPTAAEALEDGVWYLTGNFTDWFKQTEAWSTIDARKDETNSYYISKVYLKNNDTFKIMKKVNEETQYWLSGKYEALSKSITLTTGYEDNILLSGIEDGWYNIVFTDRHTGSNAADIKTVKSYLTIMKYAEPTIALNPADPIYENDEITEDNLIVTVGDAEVTDYVFIGYEYGESDGKLTATVTIRYKGAYFTETLDVLKLEITQITINTNPTKLLYYVGDTLSTAGLKINVKYNSGKTEVVSGDKLAEMFDITTALEGRTEGNLFGGNVVTVNISLKNSETEIKTSYDVTVYNKVTSITATLPEGKDEYFVGDKLDISGMTITAYFNGSETLSAPVTANYTTDIADKTPLGLSDDKIEVSFTRKVDNLGTRTVTCEIPLTVKEPQIVRIEIDGNLDKKNYTVGDNNFVTTGLEFTAIYENGKSETINSSKLTFSFGEYANADGMFIKAGTATVTVSYGDADVIGDEDITITISNKLTSIVVDASDIVKPHDVGFVDGDALTETALSGIVVKAIYNEGVVGATEVDVELTRADYTVSPAIGTELHVGDTTITVTYRTKTATFTITAVALEMTGLTVTGTPAEQYLGSKVNTSGLTFKAQFNNDTEETVAPASITFTCTALNDDGNFAVDGDGKAVTATYNGKSCTFTVDVKNITKYLVHFDVNIPGTGKVADGMPSDQTITHGDPVVSPTTTPTIKGYTFVGWYKESTCDNEWNFADVITGNKTIYAKWNSKDYAIVYSVDGSITALPISEYKATANLFPEFTLTTPAEKTGHNFVGWCFNSDLSDETPIKRMTYARIPADATDTIRLYAKYELKEYKVTFELRGGDQTYEEQTVKYGQTVTDPGTPTRKHWDFAFWYVGEEEQTNPTAYALTTPITEDTVIYARWTGFGYTVQYNLDGGTNGDNPATFSFPDPDVMLAPATKEGYKFTGWKYNGKTVDKITNDMLPNSRTDVIELTATFEKIVMRTVTFYYNDGTTEDKTVSVENGKTVAAPTRPTRDGWTFGGWYNNDGFTGDAYDFTNTAVTANLELYAKWTRNEVKVTFNYNYGTTPIVKEETIYQNETAASVKPTPDPARPGYQFMGWFRKTGETLANTAYDFSTQVSTALTLYAKWEKITGGNVIIGANDKYQMFDNSTESDYALEYKLIMDTQITAGAIVKFEVDGVMQQVYINEYSHGVTIVAGLQSSITITDTGTYSFYLQKANADDANWTIYLSYAEYVQDDGYFLVGDFNGNSTYKWANVNPAFALSGNKIEDVALKANDKVKLAKQGTGTAILWDDSVMGYDHLTADCKKLKYIGVDTDRNIVIKYPGTFTIKIVDGMIEISSDDVQIPVNPGYDKDGLYIGADLIQEFATHQGSEVKLVAVRIPANSALTFVYDGEVVVPTIKSNCPYKGKFTNWVCAAGGIFDMYYDYSSKQIWIEYKGDYVAPAEDLGGLAVGGTITHAFVVNAGGANEVWTGATNITLAAETQFTVQYGGATITDCTLKNGSIGKITGGVLTVPAGSYQISYNYVDKTIYVAGKVDLGDVSSITPDANSIVIKFSDGVVKITIKNTANLGGLFLHVWGGDTNHTGDWKNGTLNGTYETSASISALNNIIVGHNGNGGQANTLSGLSGYKNGDHITIELVNASTSKIISTENLLS